MLCGCRKIIVKSGVKVITIEPSADASSVEQVYKLFSIAFAQVCALKEVQRLGIDPFVQTRPATLVERRQALAVESEA
jgi:hypothetical protein